MLCILAAALAADPTLVLPAGQDLAAWTGPATLAGFRIGPHGAGSEVELLVGPEGWVLVARDGRGAEKRVHISAPLSPSSREDAVWLGSGLLSSLPAAPPAPAPPPKNTASSGSPSSAPGRTASGAPAPSAPRPPAPSRPVPPAPSPVSAPATASPPKTEASTQALGPSDPPPAATTPASPASRAAPSTATPPETGASPSASGLSGPATVAPAPPSPWAAPSTVTPSETGASPLASGPSGSATVAPAPPSPVASPSTATPPETVSSSSASGSSASPVASPSTASPPETVSSSSASGSSASPVAAPPGASLVASPSTATPPETGTSPLASGPSGSLAAAPPPAPSASPAAASPSLPAPPTGPKTNVVPSELPAEASKNNLQGWFSVGPAAELRPGLSPGAGAGLDAGLRLLPSFWAGVSGRWLAARRLPEVPGSQVEPGLDLSAALWWSPEGRLAPWLGLSGGLSTRGYTQGATEIDRFVLPILGAQAGARLELKGPLALRLSAKGTLDAAKTEVVYGESSPTPLPGWAVGADLSLLAHIP